MRKDIMELFGLRGLLLDGMRVGKLVELSVRSPRRGGRCPSCGKWSERIHDKRERRITHDEHNGKSVVLRLTTRRFFCNSCVRPFTEQNPVGITSSRFSEHLKDCVLSLLRQSSFDEVSSRYKVSFPTLISFLKERKQNLTWPAKGKIKLNIDEHSFSGRDLKISIGDLSNHAFRDILRDDRQETLEKYLEAIPSQVQSRISEVCIDMRASYLAPILTYLPKAKIVIDRFHVMRDLNVKLNEVRKIVQPTAARGQRRINRFLLVKNGDELSADERRELNLIFREHERFSAFKGLYVVKESMREMYKCRKREDAERVFDRIMTMTEGENLGTLGETRRMLVRWREYILNFFENRTTNAFIEGCHNRIKLIKRMSYGFRNFDNYVLKITLAFLPFLFLGIPH